MHGHPIRRLLAAAMALSALGAPAWAEPFTTDRWRLLDSGSGEIGGGTCAVDDGETGHILCFMVTCQPGGRTYASMRYYGGDFGPRIPVEVDVDGELLFSESFYARHDGDLYVYQWMLPEFGWRLTGALAGGRTGTLWMADEEPLTLSLEGSAAVLSMVDAQCTLPRFVDEVDPLDPDQRDPSLYYPDETR